MFHARKMAHHRAKAAVCLAVAVTFVVSTAPWRVEASPTGRAPASLGAMLRTLLSRPTGPLDGMRGVMAAEDALRELIDAQEPRPTRRLPAELGLLGPSHRVTGLAPGFNNTQQSYAGYIPVAHKPGAAIFYWFFAARDVSQPQNASTLLWLNGGPGSSSSLGLFWENGPYGISDDGTSLTRREVTWNSRYNMLFIDQPVGTGYSIAANATQYCNNQGEVAEDMNSVLRQFFAAYPAYGQNDFFITGESYAGHYVPNIALRVVRGNEAGELPHIPLRGIAAGNGLNNAELQANHTATSAFEKGLVGHYAREAMEFSAALGSKLHREGPQNNLTALAGVGATWGIVLADSGFVNEYNARIDHAYNFSVMTTLLNTPSVQQALHVGTTPFHSDSNTVMIDFILSGDFLWDQATVHSQLIAAGLRVVLYHGLDDPVFVSSAGEAFAESIEWSGQAGFQKAYRGVWRVDGQLAGYARQYEDFAFVQVRGAGHLVPHDQPAAAYDLITRVVSGTMWPHELP